MAKQITIRFQDDQITQIKDWADSHHVGFHVAIKRLIDRGLKDNWMDILLKDPDWRNITSSTFGNAIIPKELESGTKSDELENQALQGDAKEEIISLDDWLSKI